LSVAAAAALLIVNGAARADEQQVLDSLHLQEGTITLDGDRASVALTPHFRYLSPADTETFLTQVWGNPPGAGGTTLGALVPADVDLLGPDGWAIIISYDNSGYVSDEDAADIDYDQLLRDMQDATRENNKTRAEQGYEPIELVGWAKPPYYDSEAKKLYWAKRLRFGSDPYDTLNYDIRVLGRTGYLDLTVVGGIEKLAMIDGRINEILGMVAFNPGHTYAEFNPDLDNVAGYGIAGLIAGGVLAKAGFFKFLLALWKPIAIGAVALFGAFGGMLRRMFARA
jgi:uncharacterized membrane-anchored protein